jgi:hypothetical protein
MATCPKCKTTSKIIEGAQNFTINGKSVAYDDCIIACKCTPVGCHKIIALIIHIFIDVSSNYSSFSLQLSLTEDIHRYLTIKYVRSGLLFNYL